MGKIATIRLKQSDLDYSLLRLPTNQRNLFPDSRFILVLDDGSEIQTEFDKHQGRLRDRSAMKRYFQRLALSPGDWLVVEEIDPGRKYSLSSKKSSDPPVFQETIQNASREEPEGDEEKWTSFALEEDLRRFLIRHLDQVEAGLVLYRDKEGNEGEEYHTAVGYIDVLAVDANGDLVVFELKVGRGPDATIGQLLRYVGWIQKHLANGKKVRGIILANQIDENLRYAAEAIPNLAVYEYEIVFKLNPARFSHNNP